MNVNIKISENKETELNCLKDKMLMKNNFLYCIEDYKVEEIMEKQKKTLFGRHRPLKKALYVTDMTLRAYNGNGKFLGYMREDACYRFLIYYNLYNFHETWVKFLEQLKAFGFEVKKIETPEENPIVDEFLDNNK